MLSGVGYLKGRKRVINQACRVREDVLPLVKIRADVHVSDLIPWSNTCALTTMRSRRVGIYLIRPLRVAEGIQGVRGMVLGSDEGYLGGRTGHTRTPPFTMYTAAVSLRIRPSRAAVTADPLQLVAPAGGPPPTATTAPVRAARGCGAADSGPPSPAAGRAHRLRDRAA